MKTKAVFFDLDDTLVAFDAVTEASWRVVCERYCEKRPGLSVPAMLDGIRRASDWFWSDEERHKRGRHDILRTRRQIVASAFAEVGLPEADAAAVADGYSRLRLENMYLLPGVEPILETLVRRGTGLALLTNGDAEGQRAKIVRFGLDAYFEHILIEGELGFGKPDRRVYERALSLVGALPTEACMVGDNLRWDIEGAQALGIAGIWHDWKGAGLPEGAAVVPAAIIGSIEELAQVLELTA